MPTIGEIRRQFPQYNDMPDAALADALHQKFYADMPKADYYAKIGFNPPDTTPAPTEEVSTDAMGMPLGGAYTNTLPSKQQAIDTGGAMGAFADSALDPPIIGPALKGSTDRIVAIGKTLAGGKSYDEELKGVQEKTKKLKEQYPDAAAVGKGVGTALMMAPIMMAAPELFGLDAAAGLFGNTLTAVGSGTVLGGADAAIRGEPILKNAATEGLISGAIPIVGKAVGGIFTGILKLLTPQAEGVLKGVNKLALEKASTSAKAAGLTDEAIANMINTKGPQAFLMEYAPEMFGHGAGIAAAPGKAGKNAILESYEARGAVPARTARIEEGLNEGMGKPTNITQTTLENAEQRQKDAGPLFDQFREMQVHPTPEVKTLTEQLDKAGYLAEARQVALDKSLGTGAPISPMEDFFTTGAKKNWPTTESWSHVKQAVDKRIAASYDAHGLPTQATRDLRQIKARIDKVIGDSSPETKKVWDEAREIWGTSKAIDNARKQGLNAWNPKYTKDQMLQDLTDMSAAERAAFKEGSRAALAEHSGRYVEGVGAEKVGNFLRTENNADKFRYLTMRKGYDPEGFIKSLDHLALEKEAAKKLGTSAEENIIENGMKEMVANPANLPINKLRHEYSLHVTPLKAPLTPIGRFLEKRQLKQYEEMRDALGKLYTTQGPEAQEIARALLRYKAPGANGAQAGLNTAAVVKALGGQNTPAMQQLPFGLSDRQ